MVYERSTALSHPLDGCFPKTWEAARRESPVRQFPLTLASRPGFVAHAAPI
jgi:hypothetical protein